MIVNEDCIKHLKTIEDNYFDSVVTDPPYHLTSIVKRFKNTSPSDDTLTSKKVREKSDGFSRLATGFMGQKWDGGDIAFTTELWKEVYRTLKPGGYLLSFAASRNYHRMAVAIEDSGFEIRDQIMWIYGSGFPKSTNLGKAIDKKLGNKRIKTGQVKTHSNKGMPQAEERTAINAGAFGQQVEEEVTVGTSEWEGWGTALKPAHEPICMARKPISEKSITDNVLKHGTGGINIDGCRVGLDGEKPPTGSAKRVFKNNQYTKEKIYGDNKTTPEAGRFPANVIHDGSDEVVSEFPIGGQGGGQQPYQTTKTYNNSNIFENIGDKPQSPSNYFDRGSAARFFYCPKANKKEKGDTNHPTVKPVELMRYLVRLVTPKDGIVLDPFAGTGTTGEACILEDRNYYLIEAEESYIKDIENRTNKYNRLGI